MSIREEFVLKAREEGANVSALAQAYEVSRKTAYKWLKRFKEKGASGLADMSRRPRSTPLAASGEVVAEVTAIRLAHRRWGPKKIAVLVRKKYPDQAPSVRTVARILLRAGFVQPARRQPRTPDVHFGPPKVQPQAPNDLWTVDFKGWWLTQQRERCEPLTVRDAFSRYVLGITVFNTPRTDPVMATFKELFRLYGLPKAILTDGGPPFAAPNGMLGLTRLSAWWLSLGIELYRSRPATPGDNAAHERMHSDMADELERFAALNLVVQQQACDRWRHEFNYERPHEALDMKMPADLYRRSHVHFDDKPVEIVYPEHFLVRLVGGSGHLRSLGADVFVSWALARQPVGLEPLGARRFNVWFAHRRLGDLDFSQPKAVFSPAPWNVPSEPAPPSTELPDNQPECATETEDTTKKVA